MTIELIPAHLKKDLVNAPATAVIDLTTLGENDLAALHKTRIIAIPLLLRVIIALKQNHIDRIFIHHLPAQQATVDFLIKSPLVSSSLDFFSVATAKESNVDMLQRLTHTGCYLLNPFFLINGVMLEEFEKHFDRSNPEHAEIIRNSICKNHLLWLPPVFLRSLDPATSLSEKAKAAGKKEIKIIGTEATGQEIKTKADIKAADKILFGDVTRKKGGYLAKRLNEPVSLVIAKYCAYTPLTPNFITVLNTLLGILSAWLVYWGAQQHAYLPMAAGAVLFYLVDIFDGIDGELARFVFRFSKNGALYDTISDNITLLCFLLASTYAAYQQFPSLWVIGAGVFTILFAALAILYLYLFTMKHFGNASLRLYEARFMPLIPQDNAFIRFVFWVRHWYTKDILAAGLSLAIIFNLPVAIMVGAPLLLLMMFFGFIYMGLRYGHLIGLKPA